MTRITFTRPDPTEHALLICKLGPQWGNLKQTEHFKPAGTEWATEADIEDAGFVPKDWRDLALGALGLLGTLAEEDRLDDAAKEIGAALLDRIPRKILDEARGRVAAQHAEATLERLGRAF